MADNYYNIRFILLFPSRPFVLIVLQKRLICAFFIVFSPPLIATCQAAARLLRSYTYLYSFTLARARVAHNLYYHACAPKILLFLRTRIDGEASKFVIKPSASGRVETI